jgi:hypothetical protein
VFLLQRGNSTHRTQLHNNIVITNTTASEGAARKMYDSQYDTILFLAYSTAAISAIASIFVIAPYGRFATSSFGFELNPKFGWWLMEIMATVSFIVFYPQGFHR